MIAIDAYPLAWPTDWRRTPVNKRHRSRYTVSFARARDQLVQAIERMPNVQRRSVVVSSNVPVRRDGLPYANLREPNDPGVAVYWTVDVRKVGDHVRWVQEPRVIACDAWRTVRENLRAVGMAVEGLRAVERSRASEIIQRAFDGFAALPPANGVKSWRRVLGFTQDEILTRLRVEERYRELAKIHHPDVGGDPDRFIEITKAKEAALDALGRG